MTRILLLLSGSFCLDVQHTNAMLESSFKFYGKVNEDTSCTDVCKLVNTTDLVVGYISEK